MSEVSNRRRIGELRTFRRFTFERGPKGLRNLKTPAWFESMEFGTQESLLNGEEVRWLKSEKLSKHIGLSVEKRVSLMSLQPHFFLFFFFLDNDKRKEISV